MWKPKLQTVLAYLAGLSGGVMLCSSGFTLVEVTPRLLKYTSIVALLAFLVVSVLRGIAERSSSKSCPNPQSPSA